MTDIGIAFDGLNAFRRDLKKIDDTLAKELRVDLLVIAREIARETAQRVPIGATGRAAGSVRASVSGTNAAIRAGKADVPYYGWLDFGSRTPQQGNPRSVGPWKRSGPGPQGGRYIYPTIRRNQREIKEKAEEAFEKARDAALNKSY